MDALVILTKVDQRNLVYRLGSQLDSKSWNQQSLNIGKNKNPRRINYLVMKLFRLISINGDFFLLCSIYQIVPLFHSFVIQFGVLNIVCEI